MIFFFFFKQKTAYEMRISDWSSDVCSSDLEVVQQQGAGPDPQAVFRQREQRQVFDAPGVDAERQQFAEHAHDLRDHPQPDAVDRVVAGIDRKSVVKGKSVSVRVDLGGRRIIKKKKPQINKRNIHEKY